MAGQSQILHTQKLVDWEEIEIKREDESEPIILDGSSN